MTDIIERLDNEKTYVDAIDDAIAEIKRLRQRISELENPNSKKWVREYKGYESIMDFDEDWIDVGLPSVVPVGGEYSGTVRITFEYIPDTE